LERETGDVWRWFTWREHVAGRVLGEASDVHFVYDQVFEGQAQRFVSLPVEVSLVGGDARGSQAPSPRNPERLAVVQILF